MLSILKRQGTPKRAHLQLPDRRQGRLVVQLPGRRPGEHSRVNLGGRGLERVVKIFNIMIAYELIKLTN